MSRCFDVALSFVGQDEDLAELLAQNLERHGYRIFVYSRFSQALQGHQLRRVLPIVYCQMSRAFIAIVSKEYASASNSSSWDDMSVSAVQAGAGRWRRAIHWAGLEWEVAYSTFCREHKSVAKREGDRSRPFVYRGRLYPPSRGNPFASPDHLIVVTTDGALPTDCDDDIIAPRLAQSTIGSVASYVADRIGPPEGGGLPSFEYMLDLAVRNLGNGLDDLEEVLPMEHSRFRLRAHSQSWAPLIEASFCRVAHQAHGAEFSLAGHRRWIFLGPTFDERPGARFELSSRYPYWTVVIQDKALLGRKVTGHGSPEHLQVLTIQEDEGFFWFVTGGERYPLSAFGLAQAMSSVEKGGVFRSIKIDVATDPRLAMLESPAPSTWWKWPVTVLHRSCARALELG